MQCLQPIECYLPSDFDFEGKRRLVFSPKKIYELKCATIQKFERHNLLKLFNEDNFNLFDDTHKFPDIYFKRDVFSECPDGYIISVPCGKCQNCRINYSRLWATRACNEGYFYNYFKDCSFVSLTFNQNTLRNTFLGYSVDKAFFKSWVKRLRYAVQDKYGVQFRHLSCGEYGSQRFRPHYHMIIFGFNFPDKYVFKTIVNQGKIINYYRSPFLESLWHLPHSKDSAGYSLISDVNYETCAYVARYVTKKLSNKKLYGDQQPEFLSVSRMPGIGYNFCIKFMNDIFNHGYITLPNGFRSPIPRYYESIVEKINPELYYNYKYEKFKKLHEEMLNKFVNNSNPSQTRLNQLDELSALRYEKLVRNYEIDLID